MFPFVGCLIAATGVTAIFTGYGGLTAISATLYVGSWGSVVTIESDMLFIISLESPIRAHNETLSVIARQRSRLFVRDNPRLRHSPNSNRLC